MTRHSHEDALSESQFDELWAATDDLDSPFATECRFVLAAAGRLGLRAGELCHVRQDWIDWDKQQINIPSHDACDHGRDGGPCGYCHHRAEEAAEADAELTFKEALSDRWEPKTSNGSRAVPFGFDDRVQTAVEEFFMFYDRFDGSRSAVNRRVDRVLDAAGYPRELTYPHALRATAATWHAYRGLSAPALLSLMGWSDLQTAQKYIRLSGGATRKALQDAHGD